MTTKSIGKVKLRPDPKSGRVKLIRVHSYDASKKRRIAKAKAQKAVSSRGGALT